MRRFAVVLLLVAGCGGGWGVRTPARIDLNAMLKGRSAEEVRRVLVVRVLDDPRDVQARLALAVLAEQMGRPTDAIEQLEAVLRLGGPIGTRWELDDKYRLARLLLRRGSVRAARGSATALRDLERSREYGLGHLDSEEYAKYLVAVAQVRHVAVKERAKGRATLGELSRRNATAEARGATTPPSTGTVHIEWRPSAMMVDARAWRGALPGASPDERGRFGAWLWAMGARREAWEQLSAWRAATKSPRDQTLQAIYLRALVWWSPVWLGEAKLPPAEDLVGPERCLFPGADCTPEVAEAPPPPGLPAIDGEPRAVAAAYYAAQRFSTLPPLGANHPVRDGVVPDKQDVTTGEPARVNSPDAPGFAVQVPVVSYLGVPDAAALVPIARAFYRDATIAERLGRDLVAAAPDAAIAHATLGALFDALGDPARARAQWHAAVDASPDPAFVRGLAEAAARTRDGSAALVFGTQAAAAWGDPAVVWASLAAALDGAGQHVEALTAARNALDLAGPEVLPRALDVAIAASRALDRKAQVEALMVQRAQLGPRVKADDADARAAINTHRERPTANTVATLWVVSRAYPRDVALRATLLAALDDDDPRRATIVAELVALAGDPDSDRALAAVTALRR